MDNMEQAVDGGWGWVVVLAHGLSNIIGVGFQRNYSLIHRRLVEYYGHSESATAWVIGIHQMVKMCPSPLVAVVINKFSHRSVYMSSGILCMVSMVATAYSPSLFFVYFTFGILVALGRCMGILAGNSLIQQYFDKKRGRANSINQSFNPVGGMILAPLIQFLLCTYGYQGTMLIFGALMLHFIPFGALCHPIHMHQKSVERNDVENNNSDATENEILTGADQDGRKPHKFKSQGSAPGRRLIELRDLHDHDEFQSSYSIENMDMEDSSPKSVISEKKVKHKNLPRRVIKGCVQVFDLKLLCYFPFLSLTLLSMATITTHSINVAFLSSLAEEKGFTPQQTGVLLILISCSDLPSRFLSGFIFDLPFIRRRRLQLFVCLLFMAGLSCVALSLVKDKIVCIILWMVFQIFCGAGASQQTTCLADVIGRSRITSALGLRRFVTGFALLAAPPTAGFIRDVTGSYDIAYRLTGSFLILCVFLHVFASTIREKCCNVSKKSTVI